MDGALDDFCVSPKPDSFVLDVGSSTGGFTDCLFSAAPREVYAVDVAGQLDRPFPGSTRAPVVREETHVANLIVKDFASDDAAAGYDRRVRSSL